MEMNRNPLIIRGIHNLHMEIGEHGIVRAESAWWKGSEIRSPFSRLYLVTAGEGWVKTENRIQKLQPGHAYLIPAGMLLDFGCEEYIHKLYFHIHLTRPDGYDLVRGQSRVGEVEMDGRQLQQMMALYQSDCWLDAVELKSGIYNILIRLLRQFPQINEPISLYSPLVERGMRYVQEHLSVRIGIEELAGRLYVSPSMLARTFRREVGKTIRRYVEDMVFLAAQKRLLETDAPLSEISDELGFCDQFYFSRRFRQRYGESPGSYRRRLKMADGPFVHNEKPV